MTFNDDADIRGGRVSKRGRNAAIGAGGGGLIVIALLVVSQLTGVDLTGLAPILGGGSGTEQGTDQTGDLAACETGEDANENVECRMVGAATSLDLYWETQVDGYAPPELVLFSGSVSTGCGNATSAVGPFYCPPDQKVYIDTTFFEQLRTQFGASGGNLAQMYIVAHEWGHHIQNIVGTMDGLDLQDAGPTSDGVRLELQADCYAGAWVAASSDTEDTSGIALLQEPTAAEITDALNAANVVGDDYIQENLGDGNVNPETWTHGSSESRQKWFNAGFTEGVGSCDTFAASGSEL
ncbi:neutral zinc metallopeptidase [Pseudolysinimonas sp.]|jgi:predicted metalloprotease|uniref:KPN_02809 family neutral zinc metallopeptidase n=1 Tax=Pseudolysinimonas sp. TaxID=2680009 RepID=UPI003783E556